MRIFTCRIFWVTNDNDFVSLTINFINSLAAIILSERKPKNIKLRHYEQVRFLKFSYIFHF